MKTLKSWIVSLFLLLERIKGRNTLVEVRNPHNALGNLVGYSVMGYEISIYCQQVCYERRFNNRLSPDRTYRIYRVFSAVTKDAPAALIKACELDVCMPAFLPWFMPEKEHRRVAIDAYIDLLTERAIYHQKVEMAA